MGKLYKITDGNMDTTLDMRRVKAYGDTMNDGMMQLSFTLPITIGEGTKEAAKALAGKMGLENVEVTHMMDLGEGFTYFILYGSCIHTIDMESIVTSEVSVKKMSMEEIDKFIKESIGRRIVVVGACTGTDAHTVGIDAIMNMKGYAGHYGLERYQMIEAYNLGSQVPNEELVAKALGVKADAILVSQVVTQKNVHIPNMEELVEILEAEGLRDKIVLAAGGPRITNQLAKELGYDAGFGPGTYAEDVAAFIAHHLPTGTVNKSSQPNPNH